MLLQKTLPEAIRILLELVSFSWHETLGVPPNADAGTIRRAWARLAHAPAILTKGYSETDGPPQCRL
jgi:hypothetical protein